MGCDIHLYVERKLKNGDWAMVQNMDVPINDESLRPWGPNGEPQGGCWRLSGRNYNLFANLAGVRGFGPDPKGLPGDLSPFVAEEYERWLGDAHSASWSTPLEFMEAYIDAIRTHTDHDALDKYVQTRIKEGVEMALQQFMFDMCSLDTDQGEEYRFVYWFDN